MKKSRSVVFQLNFDELDKGKADRLLNLYKHLLRNRRLARFCRDAFIEKAERKLSGLEEQYILLGSHIKSKGIPYILDAIKEKETSQPAAAAGPGEGEIEKAVNQIIQALRQEFQKELPLPALPEPLKINNTPIVLKKEANKNKPVRVVPDRNEPDMERLMALL